MHRNPLWIFFLSLMMLSIAVYSIRTSYQLWQYLRLDKQISAQHIQWSVAALSDEEFAPLARYQFNLKGTIYEGETLWKETYLNQSTAQEAILRLSSSSPSIWYDSSSPYLSSLQKNFPFKESIYTLLLWILGLYFLGLGYYTNQRIHAK